MAMLFLDLDGVLADFDGHFVALFGRRPRELPLAEIWARAERTAGFFETMPLLPDAMDLWRFCLPHHPRILTGVPRGTWAQEQKRRWVATHLGPEVSVITCLARDKCTYASPGDVLVDDAPRYADLWTGRGGVFVLHRSAEESIAALRRLGFGHGHSDEGTAINGT